MLWQAWDGTYGSQTACRSWVCNDLDFLFEIECAVRVSGWRVSEKALYLRLKPQRLRVQLGWLEAGDQKHVTMTASVEEWLWDSVAMGATPPDHAHSESSNLVL